MTAPVRIQRKRTKGWRMPAGAVYVGRPTRWGNSYVVTRTRRGWRVSGGEACVNSGMLSERAARGLAVDLYRLEWERWLAKEPGARERLLRRLGGKDLACWCPLDKPCHADVLLELANREES